MKAWPTPLTTATATTICRPGKAVEFPSRRGKHPYRLASYRAPQRPAPTLPYAVMADRSASQGTWSARAHALNVVLNPEHVREAMVRDGRSRAAIARSAQLDPQRIGAAARGEVRRVTSAWVGKLADALDVNASYLIDADVSAPELPPAPQPLSMAPVVPNGRVLRHARRRTLRSRRRLGRRLGLAPAQIAAAERSQPTPCWVLDRLARSVGLTLTLITSQPSPTKTRSC